MTFIVPVSLITAISMLGAFGMYSIECIIDPGLFSPSTNHQEREEKCTLGLTALLTMAVILLIIADMVPKSDSNRFPLLGTL
jgi:hypothetical protein